MSGLIYNGYSKLIKDFFAKKRRKKGALTPDNVIYHRGCNKTIMMVNNEFKKWKKESTTYLVNIGKFR